MYNSALAFDISEDFSFDTELEETTNQVIPELWLQYSRQFGEIIVMIDYTPPREFGPRSWQLLGVGVFESAQEFYELHVSVGDRIIEIGDFLQRYMPQEARVAADFWIEVILARGQVDLELDSWEIQEELEQRDLRKRNSKRGRFHCLRK